MVCRGILRLQGFVVRVYPHRAWPPYRHAKYVDRRLISQGYPACPTGRRHGEAEQAVRSGHGLSCQNSGPGGEADPPVHGALHHVVPTFHEPEELNQEQGREVHITEQQTACTG